jgi:hypothetical protein
MSARTDRMGFKRSRSRIGMVTLANCRMAALRTPDQGAKHCGNLTPGGHLNSARTGHRYLAAICPSRIRCGCVKPVAAPSTRRSNVAAEGSPGTEIGRVDDAGQRSAHRDLTFCEPAAESGLAELRLTRPRHLETRPPLTTVQSRRRTVNIDPRQNQTESGIELQRLSSGRGPSGRSRLQRTVGRQTDYFRPF